MACNMDGVRVFLYHLFAVGIVIVYTFVVSMILYWIVNKLIPMRVSKESETVGLDISQHDESYNFADIDEVDDDGQLRY